MRFSEKATEDFHRIIVEWIHDAAEATIAVYGRYPVPKVKIDVRSTPGSRVEGGTTWEGRLIRVRVGTDVTAADLRTDWVMTHEMFHLGFPSTDDGLDWMGEGLSTYLEPLARARTGNLSAEDAWLSLMDGLPQGLPHSGDRGLDKTPTWGRTYWGGALFWLLADIEIRQKSGNQKSLDDVLRAIAAEGGNGSSYWPQSKILRRGDGIIGSPILQNLHDNLGTHAKTTDLDALWQQLGVHRRGRSVVFDDTAPLAGIRRALTTKRNVRQSAPATRQPRGPDAGGASPHESTGAPGVAGPLGCPASTPSSYTGTN